MKSTRFHQPRTPDKPGLFGRRRSKARKAAAVHESLDELGQLVRTAGVKRWGKRSSAWNVLIPRRSLAPARPKSCRRRVGSSKSIPSSSTMSLSPAQAATWSRCSTARSSIARAHPRHLRPAGPHARRQTPGRTGATPASAAAADPVLGSFVAARAASGCSGGEGETQLEADRRRVQERIDEAPGQLVDGAPAAHRPNGRAPAQPMAARVDRRLHQRRQIHLAQRLTGADVWRRTNCSPRSIRQRAGLRLPTNQNMLLTDTVGFIRKLPHGLVEAFKATLEEVVAGAICCCTWWTSAIRRRRNKSRAVNTVLKEIGAGGQTDADGLQQGRSLRKRRGPPGLE